jgi:hypothetical protein
VNWNRFVFFVHRSVGDGDSEFEFWYEVPFVSLLKTVANWGLVSVKYVVPSAQLDVFLKFCVFRVGLVSSVHGSL